MKLLVGIAIIVLIGFVAIRQFGDEPQNSRQVLQQGLEQVKKSRPLTTEAEELLKVQLALVDYIGQHGHPPDNLESLVPTYFDEAPVNPTTRAVFAYRREGMQFKLGKQLEGTYSNPAALSSADQAAEKENSALLEQLDFVNPNTMEFEEFIYDPEGKRDPFRPFDKTPKQTSEEKLTPLQKLSLGQLRLTAVLKDSNGNPTAIVEDSSGKGFTIRAGTLIGPDNGIVGSIEGDKVKIVQTRYDFAGNKSQSVVELKIAQKQ